MFYMYSVCVIIYANKDYYYYYYYMIGTSLMNVSDGCPTLTCLSLKLRRCYFYVISTVSMTLVIIIINYDYCHIALYKLN